MSGPVARAGLAQIGGPMAAIPELSQAGMARLCSNESPLGPSLAAVAAAGEALARGHLYPEGEGGALEAAIAAQFGVAAGRVLLGPGSDTLVLNAVLAFAGPGDAVVFPARGYARYRRNALIAGATPVAVPDVDFRADLDAMLGAVTARTRVVMIANPDNPSGAMLPLAAIEAFHARLPGDVLLLLDGAYADYVRDPAYGDGGLGLAGRAENVLVSRTFSKLFGMAGLRLGWLTGAPALLAAVGKVGPTFPVSVPALAAGVAALGDAAHRQAARAHNDRWLPWVERALGEWQALRVYPSQSNFVLVDFPTAEMVQGVHGAPRGAGFACPKVRARCACAADADLDRARPGAGAGGGVDWCVSDRRLTMVAVPQGKFDGYARNGLAGMAPDEEITRIGPGTPAGEYLRRFWQPIALASMVGELPLKLRRMGEDLVLYRDRAGALGAAAPAVCAPKCIAGIRDHRAARHPVLLPWLAVRQ